MGSVERFVQLIEEVCQRGYRIRYGEFVGKGREKALQELIVECARGRGYRAISEDVMRVRLPYHQPLMDVLVEVDGYLHGLELKIMRSKNFQFFSGLEQALAYSLNGVDYIWLIHYIVDMLDEFTLAKYGLSPFALAGYGSRFPTPIERMLRILRITQMGFLLVDSYGIRCKIKPREPVEHDELGRKLRGELLMLLDFSTI